MDFVFELSSYDSPELDAETVRMVDQLMEAQSRSILPGVWAVTDRVNQNSRDEARWPNQQRAAKRYRLYSALLLGLGIFMLVPGLMEPKELMVVLLGGVLAVLTSLAYFRRAKSLSRGAGLSAQRQRGPAPSACKAAGQLLERMRGLDLKKSPASVIFDESGVIITEPQEKTQLTAYSGVTGVFEEKHAWLLAYGERQTLLLQKKDLTVGNIEDFVDYVQERRGTQ